MKKLVSFLVLSFLMVAVLFTGVCRAGQFDRIISPADVERITGLSGIKQVPRAPLDKFRNGDLNFSLANGQPVLMIQFRPVRVYDTNVFDNLKNDAGYYKAPVKGIGEQAFTSPAFAPQFSVNFRKGNLFAVVTTNVDPNDKNKAVLKMDHLIALAKLVDSRMSLPSTVAMKRPAAR
jgi:hypothetical protein